MRRDGDPVMGVVLCALVVCAMVSDAHALISIKAAPGSGSPQIVILGGPQRPATTDDGRKLPASLKRYACTSLDGPTCSETGSATQGMTISGADLQKLFAEAIAKAALDSVSKALGSVERDTTVSDTATITKPAGSEPPLTGTALPASGTAVSTGAGAGAVAPAGATGEPAATLKTTTVKQTDDATGLTTTSSSTSVETESGHTIQTQIQIQSEGATGRLSDGQREALFRQINEQVGTLFAQGALPAAGPDGVPARILSFAFVLPDDANGELVDMGEAGEIEIVDTELLFADDEEAAEFADELFDSGAGAAVRTASSAGGAAASRRPPAAATHQPSQRSQQQQQPQVQAQRPSGGAPTSSAADAPPNSASRARSSKAVDLAPERTVATPGADKQQQQQQQKKKEQQQKSALPRGEAAAALDESTLTQPQLSELRRRAASGSVSGSGAAAATAKPNANAQPKANAKADAKATAKPAAAKPAPAAATAPKPAAATAKPAAAEPVLDDSKSHILQLFELYQKQTEQQQQAKAAAANKPKPARAPTAAAPAPPAAAKPAAPAAPAAAGAGGAAAPGQR